MTRRINGAYGNRWPDLIRADLADRFTGRARRANARWGFVRPPAGAGRVIWVRAGAEADSIRLAVEVLRAIREKRRDLRLVLTFEEDRSEIWSTTLKGLKKIGARFGPCDTPSAVRRTVDAFAPLGIVFARRTPGSNLCAELARRGCHTVALNCDVTPGPCETVYPGSGSQAEAWRGAGGASYIAEPVDLQTLLVEAQIEPNFKTYIGGARARDLWWLHNLDAGQTQDVARQWRATTLHASGMLFLGNDNLKTINAVRTRLAEQGPAPVRISEWRRTPLPPGTIVVLDQVDWIPAIAASCSAAHFLSVDSSWSLWQALAGGCPVSVGANAVLSGPSETVTQAADLARPEDMEEVFQSWRAYRADPIGARRSGDAGRRHFWSERRRAQAVSQEFLQRVYDW